MPLFLSNIRKKKPHNKRENCNPNCSKMGSLEEETLVQMVHDFIESESSCTPNFPPPSNGSSVARQAKCFTLQRILMSMTVAEAQVLEAVLKLMRSTDIDGDHSTKMKWLVTRLAMNGFHASIYQTSCFTSFGCPAGDYEYIEIIMRDGDENTKRVIVDIDFRSQFELARPTSGYKQLTDSLPALFVGTEEKLNRIISLLCSAAKQSLRERGLHLPPWRTSMYMQSKWLSRSRKLVAANGNDSSQVGWAPDPSPMVRPKMGGSGLSSQFSATSINCC